MLDPAASSLTCLSGRLVALLPGFGRVGGNMFKDLVESIVYCSVVIRWGLCVVIGYLLMLNVFAFFPGEWWEGGCGLGEYATQ